MNGEIKNVNGGVNFVTEAKFAEYVGKTVRAVSEMRKNGKVPWVEMKDPEGSRGEYYIDIADWNKGLRMAREKLPKEVRDGWLIWLGIK